MTKIEAEMLRKIAEEIEEEGKDEDKKEDKDEEKNPDDESEKDEDKKAQVIAAVKEITKGIKDALKEVKETPKVVEKKVAQIHTLNGVKEFSFPTDLSNLSDEEKIVSFFKALVLQRSHPYAPEVLRALNEGTTTEGGYLVPSPLATEVWRILPDVAIMRNVATVIPMTAQTLDINTLTAKPVAYWTSEYAQKTTTSAEFGQEQLSVNDLVCLLPVTEQLAADANIDIVRFVTQLFAEAIATAEDKAYFAGSGTGQPTGLNSYTLGTQIDAGGALAWNHVIELVHSLPQAIRKKKSCVFVGHRYILQLLRTLADSNTNYYWRTDRASQGEVNEFAEKIYGYKVYEQNDLAQSELYFGDLSYYLIGDRKSLEVRTTTEGGDAWRRNSIEIKAVIRVDGLLVNTDAVGKITNAV